jgi:uncharacterized membrane protein YecN with MAPEG domain
MTVFLYTGVLGFLYFVVSLSVIKARGQHQVSLGAGETGEILHLVSAHSNFASYTPLFLIGLYLLETGGLHLWALHGLGVVFLIGRVLHFLSMKDGEQNFKYRKAGMMMTLWPLIIMSSLLSYFYLEIIFKG